MQSSFGVTAAPAGQPPASNNRPIRNQDVELGNIDVQSQATALRQFKQRRESEQKRLQEESLVREVIELPKDYDN